MPGSFLDDPKNKSKILENYSLLNDLGILSYMDKVAQQLRNMEELLDEAGQLFQKESVDELMEFLSQKLLSKFVPNYLVFIFEEAMGSGKPTIAAYKNMKAVSIPLFIPSLEPYKHFFSLTPHSVDFDVFQYMVGKAQLTDLFLPLDPQKVIPILSFAGPIGFILVGKKILGESYSEEEMRYLDRLISFGSLSLQNTLHYQMAIMDYKTGLFNHSFFTQRMEEELARVHRYQSQMTLVILDVDHFKIFNDTHGHLAGDKVLEEVAKVLKGCIRQEDIAARFGGEEFILLLIQCNQNYGWLIGERVRKRIMKHHVHYEGKELKVTVSVGIAHCSREKPVPDSASLLAAADQALYQSKKNGRNRTTLSPFPHRESPGPST